MLPSYISIICYQRPEIQNQDASGAVLSLTGLGTNLFHASNSCRPLACRSDTHQSLPPHHMASPLLCLSLSSPHEDTIMLG